MKKTNHFYRFCALALSCLLLVSLFPVMQAFAVDRAAERRNVELVIVGQLDIVVKHNGFTARPGVERAGMREGS